MYIDYQTTILIIWLGMKKINITTIEIVKKNMDKIMP